MVETVAVAEFVTVSESVAVTVSVSVHVAETAVQAGSATILAWIRFHASQTTSQPRVAASVLRWINLRQSV